MAEVIQVSPTSPPRLYKWSPKEKKKQKHLNIAETRFKFLLRCLLLHFPFFVILQLAFLSFGAHWRKQKRFNEVRSLVSWWKAGWEPHCRFTKPVSIHSIIVQSWKYFSLSFLWAYATFQLNCICSNKKIILIIIWWILTIFFSKF